MIGVFVGLCILALLWYAQISNYLNHLVAVTSAICAVSFILMIIGSITAVFFNVSLGYVILPFIVFDVLITIAHLFLLIYPNHITKRHSSNPPVEYLSLGKGGAVLAISLALVCVSISFALSTPSGLTSLTQLMEWEQGVLPIINHVIFIAAFLTIVFMIVWLKVKPDTN
jgi:hypothetical protein